MTLHEPATFATDMLLAGWGGWLASRLREDRPAVHWWRRAFLLTSAAALFGGVYHGFRPEMPPAVAVVLWRTTLLPIVATSLCLLQAGITACCTGERIGFWQRLAWAKAAVFAGWTLINPVFLSAIADYGSAMLLLLSLELHAWRHRRVPHAKPIVAGIVISVLAALVQQARWSPHPHFNHNDLYHVIQALALGAFFRGARLSGEPGDIAAKRISPG
jgi:hypothetical protein